MKYKHYAPKAQVTILRGDFDKYRAFVDANKADGVWALCFDGEGAQLDMPFIEYGKNHDGVTQAHHLFTALRDLDKHGAQVVYARCPEQDGRLDGGLQPTHPRRGVPGGRAMKVVGITGRSGCGKSSATNFLREKGYPCIDADLVAREVLLPGSPCIAQLQQVFGADIADENGTVRRRLLADRAFATPEGTAALTDITQPEILRRIDAALDEARRGGADLAFVDGAVIVGTPFEARCDALILVTAPYETSVARHLCPRRHRARDGPPPSGCADSAGNAARAATAELVNDSTPDALHEKLRSVLNGLEKEGTCQKPKSEKEAF